MCAEPVSREHGAPSFIEGNKVPLKVNIRHAARGTVPISMVHQKMALLIHASNEIGIGGDATADETKPSANAFGLQEIEQCVRLSVGNRTIVEREGDRLVGNAECFAVPEDGLHGGRITGDKAKAKLLPQGRDRLR